MTEDNPLPNLRSLFERLIAELPSSEPELLSLGRQQKKRLQKLVDQVSQELSRLHGSLDEIRQPLTVLDPADPKVVGELIGKTLMVQNRIPLGAISESPFYGSGAYAIYYRGGFPSYAPIRDTDTPIYIGKANPKTHNAINPREQGDTLSARLRQHAKSIEAARNLDIADFDCRYLVVVTAWQDTAEKYLIREFHPVWNKEMKVCQGFGKHGDSPTTRDNERSRWDTLHPGRSWATGKENKANRRSAEEIKRQIAEHFETYPPKA